MTKKDLERAALISRVRDRLEKAGFKYTSSTFPQALHENAGSSTVTGVDANIGSGSGIEHEQNKLSGRDLKVYLHATASEIVKNIESGRWTATEVVSAYIRQAIEAHERTNCLTEILFEDALKEAKELDTEFANTKRLRGAFHGVPVSFKDQFEIKGYDASIGFTTWANNPSTRSAHLVNQVRSQGAIIIAKTNVPQTMLSFECSNPLFGRTLNPWSLNHTCGGSSGGEAALLAQNGSALGVGSDIGGSLRIPTGYCGIYSLKPSAFRLSKDGALGPCPGFEAIPTVVGPMARSVDDVELACRTLFGMPGASYEILPNLPYVEPSLPKKLRFGYYTSDAFVKASPASKRAVTETIEALKKQGHECIEFEPTLAFEAMKIFVGLTSADGYSTLLSHLGPDPKESSLFLVTLGPKVPGLVKSIAAWVVRNILGDSIFSEMLLDSRVKTTKEFYALVAQRNNLRKRWYEEVWDKHHFDGIIAPVQASPALPHGATKTLSPLAAATILYNIIDSPVGVVPVTRVDPAQDQLIKNTTLPVVAKVIPNQEREQECKDEPGHGSKLIEQELYFKKRKQMKVENKQKNKEGNSNDNISKAGEIHNTTAKTATTSIENNSNSGDSTVYDPLQMKGLPVSVQIVGRSFEDEKVVALMKVVDQALGPRGFGPGAWPPAHL